MEELDSGWNDALSSLDSEMMNNFDISEAMNSFDQSEIRQQVLEMINDPAMPFPAPNVNTNSVPENKQSNTVDCSSLSSEIFLATRLLHDETLDTTTLNTLGDTDSSSYNDNANINNYLGSPLRNDVHQDVVDGVGLTQREALDSEFLYSSFERLNSEKQDFDEECSNKSWTETLPPSEIMPAYVPPMPRKSSVAKKPRERKKRIVKSYMSKVMSKIDNPVPGQVQENSSANSNSVNPINSDPIVNTAVYEPSSSTPILPTQKRPISNSLVNEEYLIPSTSGVNNYNNIIQKKDGRRVPSYLKMYRLNDDKYPDVFACKNCLGIYTTLDSAIFHSCLKKRRGRRPKLLQDCLVPS